MVAFMDQEADGRSVVLVGIDFSENAERALRVGSNLALGAPHPELHLVHVLPVAIGPAGPATAMAGVPQVTGDIERVGVELMKMAGALTDDKLRVIGHVREGSAHREIAQLASDIAADLIVVGTHGRTGLERLLLGSVAEQLVRFAPCPVLTVRPKQVQVWPEIEPPCPDCTEIQRSTKGARLWCDRHSQHHARAHTHYQYPSSFGVGSQTLR